eukprot:c4713_g1_i2 orf=129-1619(+)
MDYYKLMVPSQLTAERGSDVVVINPGSRNLRVGLASNQCPLVVPQLIAWQTTMELSEEENTGPRLKGAVGEKKSQFGKGSTNAAKKGEREECLQQIEMELGVQPSSKEEGRSWQKKLDALETVSADSKDKQFAWTDVKLQEKSDSERMRKFICGEEALKIPSTKAYTLRRPICRGRFNASEHYSFQQVCDDICTIWDWALTNELGLHAKLRQQLSAVLVVPDTLDSREIKELLTIILRDLQFSCAVIHQESVAVTFGTGASSGCVVNIGAQVTSVICVEEGVALPSTRVILPFGGEDISRCLLWLQQSLKSWPPVECDPLSNPLDLLLLDKVKETHCRIEDGDHRACVELQFHTYGGPSQTYRVILSELNVPPLGLFFPVLLAPEEYVPLPRPWYHTDSEEIILDDAIHVDTVRRPDGYETGLAFGNHMSEHLEHSVYGIVRQSRLKSEERMIGLSEAIVNSILLAGRIDIQKKLFSSIQLFSIYRQVGVPRYQGL